MKLNDEQKMALAAIKDFLGGNEKFFLLSGAAGTGKTYCLHALALESKKRILYTAPTNKAVSVINKSLKSAGVSAETATIYSFLGLKLEASGAIKVLRSSGKQSFPDYDLVVIDEASMINAQLFGLIEAAALAKKLKFLFLGDPYQLPPVGEMASKVWGTSSCITLKEVVRHKNTILDLASYVKNFIGKPPMPIRIQPSANVKFLTVHEADKKIKDNLDQFLGMDKLKILSWRNAAVDNYNLKVRRHLFVDTAQPFVVGDRVMLKEPAKINEGFIANTNDEGVIQRIEIDTHELHSYVIVYKTQIALDDGRIVNLTIPTPEGQFQVDREKERLSEVSKQQPRMWKTFWEFHESFHYIAPAYSLTVHKSQGSTYDEVIIDYKDILSNRNHEESLRCLYVAVTRAKNTVWLLD